MLRQLAPLSPSIPQVDWDGVRVKFAHHQVERLKEAGLMDLAREMSEQGYVGTRELVAHPGRFLMSVRGSAGVTKLFDAIGPDRIVLVWSMWRGYWERNERHALVGVPRRRRAALHPQRRARVAGGPRPPGRGHPSQAAHLGAHRPRGRGLISSIDAEGRLTPIRVACPSCR